MDLKQEEDLEKKTKPFHTDPFAEDYHQISQSYTGLKTNRNESSDVLNKSMPGVKPKTDQDKSLEIQADKKSSKQFYDIATMSVKGNPKSVN